MPGILEALLSGIKGVGAGERTIASGTPPPINPQTATPQIPDFLKNSDLGQNLPPAVGNVQSPFNIAGRALGGTVSDIGDISSDVRGMQFRNPIDLITNLLQNPSVRETIGSATGQQPDSFIPVNLDKQKDATGIDAPVTEAPTVPPQGAETETDGSNKFFEFFKSIGIPLAVTGVGVGIPGALPGAAGFQQGFVNQILESTDDEGEQLDRLTKLVQLENSLTEGQLKKKKLEGGDKERKGLTKTEFDFIKPKLFESSSTKALKNSAAQQALSELAKPQGLNPEQSSAWDRANPREKAEIIKFLKTGR